IFVIILFFFFQAEDGIRDYKVTGVQTCALPICPVPNAGVGALIGYIRLSNGQVTQPFLIGSQQSFSAQADGRLFLAINDDNYSRSEERRVGKECRSRWSPYH